MEWSKWAVTRWWSEWSGGRKYEEGWNVAVRENKAIKTWGEEIVERQVERRSSCPRSWRVAEERSTMEHKNVLN